MNGNWPPSLKKFVNDTFAACTDANRPAVEAELKAAIFKAFNEKTIWQIDWPSMKLEALAKPAKTKRKKYVLNERSLQHADAAQRLVQT